MRKLKPGEEEVTCSRSQGWSETEPLCLPSSSVGLNVPRSELSIAHLGPGLSANQPSGNYWQACECELDGEKGPRAKFRTQPLPHAHPPHLHGEAPKSQRAEGVSQGVFFLGQGPPGPSTAHTWMFAHVLSASVPRKPKL